MNSNLPPGVTEAMLPGNRPEDEAWERFHEKVDNDADAIGLSAADARARWDAVPDLIEALDWALAQIRAPERLIRGQNDRHYERYYRAESALSKARGETP